MLLTRLAKCGRDSGSALIAVIGVMAVGLILTTLIATTLVGGMGYSTAARAGVQSHASADAGIVAARTALFSPRESCGQRGHLHNDRAADLHRQSRVRRTAPGWQTGCPTDRGDPGSSCFGGNREVRGGRRSVVRRQEPRRGNFPVAEAGRRPAASPSTCTVAERLSPIRASISPRAVTPGLIVKDGDFVCNKNGTKHQRQHYRARHTDVFGRRAKSRVMPGCHVAANRHSGRIGGDLTAPVAAPSTDIIPSRGKIGYERSCANCPRLGQPEVRAGELAVHRRGDHREAVANHDVDDDRSMHPPEWESRRCPGPRR